MEEEKYTVYDLEEAPQIPEEGAEVRDQRSENAEKSEKSPAETEIQRMVKEMGADTVLDIIRDNRNAAIRQVISEIQTKSKTPLPSGVSAASSCNSIFDLAALA